MRDAGTWSLWGGILQESKERPLPCPTTKTALDFLLKTAMSIEGGPKSMTCASVLVLLVLVPPVHARHSRFYHESFAGYAEELPFLVVSFSLAPRTFLRGPHTTCRHEASTTRMRSATNSGPSISLIDCLGPPMPCLDVWEGVVRH